MPASDILNPSPYWQETLQDSLCPNYGFTRKRATTRLTKKAVGSTPWSRETENTGHSFPFSWLQRSLLCMKTIKRYYEQYEDGFFTIIDWDDIQPGGAGRQYVGRFTGDFPAVETANGVWDIQNLMFEEMPSVAMVSYPLDWDNDAVDLYAFDDFGAQKLAVGGSWSVVEQAVGTATIAMLADAAPAWNDWACYEYRGYGFQLYLMFGPDFGQYTLAVDGTATLTGDCTNAGPAAAAMACSVPDLPLDFHRVQITQSPVSFHPLSGATYKPLQWAWLQVMR
jgi:hypothetical protein